MEFLLTSIVNFMFLCRFWRMSRKFSILSSLSCQSLKKVKVKVVPYTLLRRGVPVREDTYPEPSACEVGWPVPFLAAFGIKYKTVTQISFPVFGKCVFRSYSVPVFDSFVEVVFQVAHYKSNICGYHFLSHSCTSNLNVIFSLESECIVLKNNG